jgi:hypothetical protein
MTLKVDEETLRRIVYWSEQKPPLYDSAHEELLHAWAKLLRPLVSTASSTAAPKPDAPGWELVEPARLNAEYWRKAADGMTDQREAVIALAQVANAYKTAPMRSRLAFQRSPQQRSQSPALLTRRRSASASAASCRSTRQSSSPREQPTSARKHDRTLDPPAVGLV